MGKGDRRTKRGKIFRGSHGKTRARGKPAKHVAPGGAKKPAKSK